MVNLVLGTPSIRCNSFVGKLSYLNELEHKFKLTRGFYPEDEINMINYAVKIAKDDFIKKEFKKNKELMLKQKVNLTSWFYKTIN